MSTFPVDITDPSGGPAEQEYTRPSYGSGDMTFTTPAFIPPTYAPDPTAAPGNADQQNALAVIRTVLDQYGLGSLADWAWDQIVNGASDTQILQLLRDRPEYKQRFVAITEREKKGLTPMSPAEVIAYEKQAAQLLRAAGMPQGFYDHYSDFANLIGNDVSVSELSSRVNEGYQRVAQADPTVRNAFRDYFGIDGDAALASYFLDPDKSAPVLSQYVAAAEFGGASLRFGFAAGQMTALQAAQLGVTKAAAQQGFSKLADLSPLFSETINESRDLSAEREGVNAMFGTGAAGDAAASSAAIDRRRQERSAAFAGGGGADLGRQGAVGLGSAK